MRPAVLGGEPSDGSCGVGADDDLALSVQDEPGCLQVGRLRVHEGARCLRELVRVGAMTHREGQLVLLDQRLGRLCVVHGQGDDCGSQLLEHAPGPLETAQLGAGSSAQNDATSRQSRGPQGVLSQGPEGDTRRRAEDGAGRRRPGLGDLGAGNFYAIAGYGAGEDPGRAARCRSAAPRRRLAQ